MDLAPIKYTCSQSNCADLEHAFKFYNEVGRDYLYSRVVREGFQTVEWDEDEDAMDKRALRLGRSIISPMADSVRRVGKGEKLYDEVTLRFQNPQTLQEFEEYFRRLGIDAIFDQVGYSGGELMVKLQKLNQSTTDKTESMWEGNLW
jgi:putative ATP-dependent DNA ligase